MNIKFYFFKHVIYFIPTIYFHNFGDRKLFGIGWLIFRLDLGWTRK